MENKPAIETWPMGWARSVHWNASRQCVGQHARVVVVSAASSNANWLPPKSPEVSAPRTVQEEEDRTSALVPTLPLVTSPFPSLPEPSQFSSESVLVPSDVSSYLESDRSHQTTSQNSRNQSWSMPPDVLSREMGENAQNVRALESVYPMDHQELNVQRQPSEELTLERQWSNQTRERTIERAEEPPTQRPRLENPASSIRWSRVDDPGRWVPATTLEDEEDMWTETDREVLWQKQVDDHIWKNNGQPACLCQEEWDELFSNTCENVTAHVCSVDLNSLA